jgi:hypothetical protein
MDFLASIADVVLLRRYGAFEPVLPALPFVLVSVPCRACSQLQRIFGRAPTRSAGLRERPEAPNRTNLGYRASGSTTLTHVNSSRWAWSSGCCRRNEDGESQTQRPSSRRRTPGVLAHLELGRADSGPRPRRNRADAVLRPRCRCSFVASPCPKCDAGRIAGWNPRLPAHGVTTIVACPVTMSVAFRRLAYAGGGC